MENKYNKFDVFTARSQFLAGYFMLRGHRLIGIAPNRERPERNVFYFVNSEKLIEDYEKYNIFRDHVNKYMETF